MKELTKKTIKVLDSLNDGELIYWLYINYGFEEPVWEEIAKDEYDRNLTRQYGDDEPITKEMLLDMLKKSFSKIQYKKEPIGLGLLDRLNGKEPKGYKYYKSTHMEKVLAIGGALYDYVINKRGLKVKTQ